MIPRAAAPRILIASVAVLVLALPASAGAATWDTTALDLSPGYGSGVWAMAVAPTDDGAVWATWAVDPSGAGGNVSVFARRVSADGVPGAIRTLLADGPLGGQSSVAMVAVPGGGVRVAYLARTIAGTTRVSVRRLTPDQTGDEAYLYDAATTEDGDVTANGPAGAQQLVPAPDGATWSLIRRENGGSSVIDARRIAPDGSIGPVARASGAEVTYEAAGAVDGLGGLVVAMPLGAQGRVAAVRIATGGGVGAEAEVGPSSPLAASAATPAIGIDGSGMATIGWQLDTFSTGKRIVQVQRLDTLATPMTTSGAPVTSLDDGLPSGFGQYGPLLAVDPGGSVIAGWRETDSPTENNDAIVRALAPGPLSAVGAIGPRLQLDEPPPQAGELAAVLPGSGGITTAFLRTWVANTNTCSAARLTTTGGLAGTDPLPSSCTYPNAPASAANGLASVWSTNSPSIVQIARVVTAPSCSDGAPVSVEVRTTTTFPLACTGWRAAREIVGAPTRGTLGAIDEVSGTVRYTAGEIPGADAVTFRAANAAGAGTTRSVPITVTPAPSGPPGPGAPAPATTDRTTPVITALRVKPPKVKLTAPRSPTATFSLSEAATVTVTVERLRRGRRAGGRCLPAKRKPPARAACTKATRVSQMTRVAPAGAARVTIGVRRGKRTLPAGSYRVTVSAVDAAGNRSTPATARFTIAF